MRHVVGSPHMSMCCCCRPSHNVFHHSCHQARVSRASSAYLLSLITGSDRGVRAVPSSLRLRLPIAAYRRRRRSVGEAKNDLGWRVLARLATDRLSRRASESARIRRRRPRGPRLIHASAVRRWSSPSPRVKFRKLWGRAKWSFVRPGEHIRWL